MIRRANVREDREKIIRLVHQELWPFTRRIFPGRRFPRKDVQNRLRIRDVFVKVGNNGEVVGFVMTAACDHMLLVDLLAVDRHKKGRGVGTSLMTYVERFGRRKGLEVAWLYVDDSNEKAMRFYEKLGYTAVSYIPNLKSYIYQKYL